MVWPGWFSAGCSLLRPACSSSKMLKSFATGVRFAIQGMPIKAERGRTFPSVHRCDEHWPGRRSPDIPEILASIGEFVPVEAFVVALGMTLSGRNALRQTRGHRPFASVRLYLVARRDGKPIVSLRTKARIKRPSKAASLAVSGRVHRLVEPGPHHIPRQAHGPEHPPPVAKGLWRQPTDRNKPFIVPQRGTSKSHTSTHSIDSPLSTISASGTHHALVQPVTAPFLTECANGSSQRNFDIEEPLRTQVAQVKGGRFAMVAARLAPDTPWRSQRLRTGRAGQDHHWRQPRRAGAGWSAASMVTLRKGSVGATADGALGASLPAKPGITTCRRLSSSRRMAASTRATAGRPMTRYRPSAVQAPINGWSVPTW